MCCWIPSNIVFILPLVGYQVSSHLLGLITVCVIQINSALDPLLYTILTPEMRRNFVKVWRLLIMRIPLLRNNKTA